MNTPPPTVKNLLDQSSLRWIFVGGKGGVGKTTCSCCIAVELAKVRERVLIISTDPAHNLSDAFDQKFSKLPTRVTGFSNLYAMEIDPSLNVEELEEDIVGADEAARSADFRRTLTNVMNSFPGVDEYMSYTEIFRLVRTMDYSVVVFDTAPTGHTLRLLSFPDLMESGLTKLISLKSTIAPIMNQMMSFIGAGNPMGSEDISQALESRLPVVREITRQFKDPSQTTFVCVCIAEFLSMYETERLVQALAAQEIDIHNIIVNQLLFPNLPIEDGDEAKKKPISDCRMCLARHRIQSKYLEQILELYDDMHVIQLPQLEEEVRGVDRVRAFSKHLLTPYIRPAPK
uniref:ATPase ASNA1 homolog n=2 Tax=Schistocephalus solidus TaxID=70667 RepID=A0A0X3NQF4_SCHSO